tara:strand:+ start:1883 stop:2260 length:378 start_codon:yes stop_codon:yes gene_type:complete
MKDLILVAGGSIFGCWLRFFLMDRLSENRLLKKYSTVIVNTFATFGLGILCSFQLDRSLNSGVTWIQSFLVIGLIGSLSTFSTFIFEIFEIFFVKKQFYYGLKNLFLSLSFGILAAFAGYHLFHA